MSPTTCATVRSSVGLKVGMNMDMICTNYVRSGEEQCGLVGTEICRYDSYVNGLCNCEICRYDSYVVTDLRTQPGETSAAELKHCGEGCASHNATLV